MFSGLDAAKTLIQIGAPVTVEDLKQRTGAEGSAKKMRAHLKDWSDGGRAARQWRRRAWFDIFLFGACAHGDDLALGALGGMRNVLESIGAYAGAIMTDELRRRVAIG